MASYFLVNERSESCERQYFVHKLIGMALNYKIIISEIYLYCHSSPSVSAAGSKGGTPLGSQLELSWLS